ncbi:MAG TPA: 2-amino-4-hydroxy-6-hydroxymethyldihydropteridine diphosphokinase [Anaerolineales bacterium]
MKSLPSDNAVHIIYLGAGTNLGNRLENLEGAAAAFPPLIHLTAASPVYQTAPWGYLDQPDFYNQVFGAETTLGPQDLLKHLKQLETNLGRKQGVRYGPRLIDLDILFYDDLVLETGDLVIPHPRLAERGFVLVPLADIAPDLVHPVLGLSIRQLLENLGSQDVHRI